MPRLLLAVALLGACHPDPPKDTGALPGDTACADAATWYADHDGDGYGDAAAPTSACGAPAGFVADATDCDDSAGSVNPGAAEVWYDGADEDCSGGGDYDQDGDGYVRDAECDDRDPSRYPDATIVEVWYNGVDENCDGNDGDQDGDGWYEAGYPFEVPKPYASRVNDCWDDPTHADGWATVNGFPALTAREVHPGAPDTWYDGLDQDCGADDDFDADRDAARTDAWPDRDGAWGNDCVDTDPAIHPGAADPWYDGVDQDCRHDDDFDADADGYDAEGGGGPVDCDDTDPARNPAARESCGTPGDDNCDGVAEEEGALECVEYRADLDGDSYGSTDAACLCAADAGHSATVGGDCDDGAGDIHPGAAEACDGRDDDCDGTIDDGLPLYYPDLDGDGYGGGAGSCSGAGSVTADDCNDGDPYVFPGATELCDGQQNDCDSGWSAADESGTVSLEEGTSWSDVTATLAAGTNASPTSWTLRDGTRLSVCPGTWYVHLTADPTAANAELVGRYGALVTILDGGGSDAVLSTSGNRAIELTISGLTLQNGSRTSGGGVYLPGGVLNGDNLVITRNQATTEGGGIYTLDAELNLTSSVVSMNEAGSTGGGIYAGNTTVSLDGVTLSGNLAWPGATGGGGGGGGMTFVSDGAYDVTIAGSTFIDNQTVVTGGTAYAGALNVYQAGSGITDISATSFTTNGATAGGGSSPLAVGGAIYAYLSGSGDTALTDVTMTGNTALAASQAEGGAAYLWNQGAGSVVITGMDAESNYVTSNSTYGGAFVLSGTGAGPISLVSSTIVSNTTYTASDTVGGVGGGMYTNLSATAMTIDGTTFAYNAASSGGGIYASINVGSTLDLQNGTAVASNTGHGVQLQALDAASQFRLDDSRITANTSVGLFLQASGRTAGINASCSGSSSTDAGIYENGSYGVYGGCTSLAVCLFQATACDFDNPTTGVSNTGYDVAMYGSYGNYLDDATFSCNGVICL